jgi:hypothetical protein
VVKADILLGGDDFANDVMDQRLPCGALARTVSKPLRTLVIIDLIGGMGQ